MSKKFKLIKNQYLDISSSSETKYLLIKFECNSNIKCLSTCNNYLNCSYGILKDDKCILANEFASQYFATTDSVNKKDKLYKKNRYKTI